MATIATHIHLDERGRAWIDETNTKVIEVVLDRLAYDWSPEAIHIQHPHLSLAQIHAALAFYYDNKAEMDAEIERQEREIDEIFAKLPNPVTRQMLLDRLQSRVGAS